MRPEELSRPIPTVALLTRPVHLRLQLWDREWCASKNPLVRVEPRSKNRSPDAVGDEENVAVVVEARLYPRAWQRVCNEQFQTQTVAFAHGHSADIEFALSDSILEFGEAYATLCDQAPPAPPLLTASPTTNASGESRARQQHDDPTASCHAGTSIVTISARVTLQTAVLAAWDAK
jgi:hypothetical protein